MRRMKIALLVGLLAVTDARIMASGIVPLQPVAAAVVDAKLPPSASRNQEQRPRPMDKQDMQETQGGSFWGWVVAIGAIFALGFLIGLFSDICGLEGVECS